MASGSLTSPLGTEIAVIGGGIAGLSTALFLARDGAEVTVIERAEPWSEASGANAGTLSLQVKIIPVLALARYALDLWESLRGMGSRPDLRGRGVCGWRPPKRSLASCVAMPNVRPMPG